MTDKDPLPKRQPGKAGNTEKKLAGKRDLQKKTTKSDPPPEENK